MLGLRWSVGMVVWSACVFAVGCDGGLDPLDDHRKSGELGNDAFYYLCVDDTDVACNEGGYATFPEVIGAGGRFALEFGGFERALGTIEPASSTFMARDGEGFVATGPGVVAMLARDATDAHVLDFVHVAVEEPSVLALSAQPRAMDARPSETQRVGAALRLSAVPTSEAGSRLGGAREPYHWSSSDESILQISGDAAGPRADAWALAVGTVSVVAQSGELAGRLELTVEPADGGGVAPEDAGASAAHEDAGDDDGGR